jgi:hypothetical protein
MERPTARPMGMMVIVSNVHGTATRVRCKRPALCGRGIKPGMACRVCGPAMPSPALCVEAAAVKISPFYLARHNE